MPSQLYLQCNYEFDEIPCILLLLGTIAHFGASAPVGREAMRVSPIPESTKYALGRLGQAASKRIDKTGQPETQIALRPAVPEDTLRSKYDAFANSSQYASSGVLVDGTDFINYNPNSSREVFAHELGHIASRNTDIGNFIHKTRHSPALRNSIAKAALLTVPAGAAAALMPGDGDMDESIALASLIAAPEILDELNATRHGLGIMKDAGMPADRGQKARLAGAALSYMALPIAAGAFSNLAGNLVDREPKSPGELPVS